jgi:DNA primase
LDAPGGGSNHTERKIAVFNESWRERLLANSDIVEILSQFLYLEKRGGKYWACCPFHHEKTPSFVVNAREQYYHCFGCGVSGNVITFIMEHERMDYVEAVEWLARRAGMDLPDEETEEEKRARIRREKILEVMRLAARFYFDNLRSPNGKAASEYIKKRGLSESTVVEFGMGYSPDFQSLPDYLIKKGYDLSTLKDACLVSDADGRIYDFFGERLIIPIINAKDQVIAFGGRTLEKEKQPKYKNSSNTVVFDKRKTLFGINLIKKLQQQETVSDLILVEGYMDVISLRQAGIKNAVASMGTSLTVEQCKELRKYTNTVYVSYDGDAAGQMATWRSLDLLAAAGLEVRVLTMPEGLDPDDTVRKEGYEGYMRYKSEALPLVDFKLRTLASKYNLLTADGKNKFATAALEILAALDPIARDVYVKEVSRLSGLAPDTIKNSLEDGMNVRAQLPRTAERAEEEPRTEINARLISARYLLSAVFAGKEFVKVTDIKEEHFDYAPHKAIGEYVLRCIAKRERPLIGALYNITDNKEEIEKVINAAASVPADAEREYYQKCIRILEKSGLQKRKAELLEKIRLSTDPEETELYKEELRKLLRR